MKSIASKFFAFFVFALLCTAVFPTSALARPVIKYQIEHANLYGPGEVEIVGYFVNEGDQGAFVKWTEIDLTLIADNGQEMWSDAGIRHYLDEDIYLDPGDYVEYIFYIQNPDIPEYHGTYRKRWHSNTHWEKAAG